MAIHFYRLNEPYGEFSNFSHHPMEIDGMEWPTVEHWFQAQKFPETPLYEQIRAARKPGDAKRLGQSVDYPLRQDWEQVKEDVMRIGADAKFRQHAELQALLLSTGDELLVENAPNDSYWGCGADGRGRNRLGIILMELRNSLRSTFPPSS